MRPWPTRPCAATPPRCAAAAEGADVNAAQGDGMTALHWAASRGDRGEAQMLLYAGARVDAATRNGTTRRCTSRREGNAPVVKVLLDAGADATAAHDVRRARRRCTSRPRPGTWRRSRPCSTTARRSMRATAAWGETPLMWAAAYNRVPGDPGCCWRSGADLKATSRVEDIAEQEADERTGSRCAIAGRRAQGGRAAADRGVAGAGAADCRSRVDAAPVVAALAVARWRRGPAGVRWR